MIYSIDSVKYHTFLITPIPDRLANRPEFIKHFNLPTEGSGHDDGF